MHILYAIIIFICSIFMIKYREKLQSITGQVSFAEKYLGAGGTFTLYALLGSFGVVLSILILFNAHTVFIEKVVRLLFG